MRLKRDGGTGQALALCIACLLYLALQGIVIAHLVTVGDWHAALSPLLCVTGIFLFFFVILDIFAVAGVVALPLILYRNRLWRAAMRAPDLHMPAAKHQPDRELALRPGETLILTRRKAQRRGAAGAGAAFATAVVLAVCGELLILPLLPAFTHSALNPLYLAPYGESAPAFNPGPLDWLAAAFPVLSGLGVAVAVLAADAGKQVWQLVADDRGVTLAFGRRPRFIPWDDVLLFFRAQDTPTDAPHGVYHLWGRTHHLALTVDARKAAFPLGDTSGEASSRSAAGPVYTYDGGFERYTADARRLLATVAVRSSQPLRTLTVGAKLTRGIQRRLPAQTLELDDALAAPEAGAPWPPSPAAVAAVPAPRSLDAFVPLRRRPPLASSLLSFFVLTAFLLGSLALFAFFPFPGAGGDTSFAHTIQEMVSQLPGQLATLPPGARIAAIAGLALVCLLLLAIVAAMPIAFTAARNHNRAPSIIADDLGLTRKTASSVTTKTIPWTGVRAWAVLPPAPGSPRPPTYFVFSDLAKIVWTEPADAQLAGRDARPDRRAAYRERAERLHAMIAARTDLPLRELRIGDG